MKTKLILTGRGGSGKDYMRKKMQERGFTYQISYTTRPPREGEVNGVDYHFITDEEAARMTENDEWYEAVVFNGWTYGTSKKQFYSDETSVFIMTPSGIAHIKPEDRKNCFIIFINPHTEIIKVRLLNRKMPGHSAEARIKADAEQFEGFKDYDVMIGNANF